MLKEVRTQQERNHEEKGDDAKGKAAVKDGTDHSHVLADLLEVALTRWGEERCLSAVVRPVVQLS